MTFEKSRYMFVVFKNPYNGTYTKRDIFTKEVVSSKHLSEIIKEIKTDINVSEVNYKKLENDMESKMTMQIKEYSKDKNIKLTREEIRFGLEAILNKRSERKIVEINSREL